MERVCFVTFIFVYCEKGYQYLYRYDLRCVLGCDDPTFELAVKHIVVLRERETCLFATPRVGLQPYKVRNTKYRINQTGISVTLCTKQASTVPPRHAVPMK